MLKIFFNYLLNIKWLLISTIIFLILYQFIIKYWWYFKNRNVKFLRGLPILGTQYKMILGQESIMDNFLKLYQTHSTEKLFGIYELGGTPSYVVCDPELIKKITIKDFDHFENHRFVIDTEVDSLLGRSLFFMNDQKWKDMRAALSPAFTGSKMKMMFNLMLQCSQQLVDQLVIDLNTGKDTTSNKNNQVVWEMKNLFTRFASDTIGTCAFGIEVNSIKDMDNSFYNTGKTITNFDGLKSLIFFGYASIPKIMKFFKIKLFEDKDANYFRNLILGAIDHRERNQIHRPDVIHLLMQARKGLLKSDDDEAIDTVNGELDKNTNYLKKWEDDDVVAQSVIFFVAGFDTTSTVLSFAAHALTVYPDVQSRLYEEICEINDSISSTVDENGIRTSTTGSITYEHLNRMKYLEMVVNETMRMWSPTVATDRIVTKPYTIQMDNGDKIQLNVGDGVWIPTHGMQMNEKYFPNPELFDPERFNDVNIKNIHPYTYMPFGVGPRNCIGSRFALMECKIILFTLLTKFRFEMCEKTQHPIKIRCNTGNVDAAKGFWVRLTLRD